MEKFKKRSLFDIYFKMSLDEVIDYYQQLRKYELSCDDKVKGIQIRRTLYHIVKLFLLIDEILSKRKITIISDERKITYNSILDEVVEINDKIPRDKSRVYSCTHIGRYDIESLIRGLNDSCNFIMADPGESYQNIDGLFLRMYGVTWFEMDSSIDKHAANVRALKNLKQGGNELVFPEAAYNLEPVDIVGKLHPGVFRRAIASNSYVNPVSLEQYENKNVKNYVINIGKSIVTDAYPIEEASYLAEYVQKEMIRLKKDIWAIYGGNKPSMDEFISDPLSLERYKERIDFIMRDVPPYYSIPDIVREFYEPSELMVKSLKNIGYLK